MSRKGPKLLLVVALIFVSTDHSVGDQSSDDLFFRYPPPKLHPLQDQHVVKSGEDWMIRCSGKYPLEWDLPTSDSLQSDPNMLDRIEVNNEVVQGDNPRPHVSFLHLRNVSYLDTGRYLCRYSGTVDPAFFDNVTSTYLFASDPERLIDMTSSMVFVNVPQYQVPRDDTKLLFAVLACH